MPQVPSTLAMEVENRGDVIVVTPHGRMGEMEAHQFGRQLFHLLDQGSSHVVVDLTDVPFITSTCLGIFMLAHKRVKEHSGYVRIAGAQPLVRQILEVTKLNKLFALYATADQAADAK